MQRDLAGDLGGDVATAGVDEADGIEQLGPECALQQVGGGPGLDGPRRLHIALIGGEHDDPRIAGLGADRFDRLEAAHARHLKIHKGDVGPQIRERRDRFGTVAGFADNLHVALHLDDRGNAFTQRGMIVDCQDPDRACGLFHHAACRLPSNIPRTGQPVSSMA